MTPRKNAPTEVVRPANWDEGDVANAQLSPSPMPLEVPTRPTRKPRIARNAPRTRPFLKRGEPPRPWVDSGEDAPVELKPIETRYAECRFRSRLEARWAVLFDALGLRWEYEFDRYPVGGFGSRRTYLPDFFVHDLNVWVEVKGDAEALDHRLMVDAAHPVNGLPRDVTGNRDGHALHEPRVLIVGRVPREPGEHLLLSALGGEVVAWQRAVLGCSGESHHVLPVGIAVEAQIDAESGQLVGLKDPLGAPNLAFAACDHAIKAYRAARSARFEHGEEG